MLAFDVFDDLLLEPVVIAIALLLLIFVLRMFLIGRDGNTGKSAGRQMRDYVRGSAPPETTEEEAARRLAAMRLLDPTIPKANATGDLDDADDDDDDDDDDD